MEVRDFMLLRVLAETHNITHAADQLYMTQSAVSKRIKVLEQELDVKLFIRSRNGVHLTQAGEVVLRYAKEASTQLEQLHRKLSSLQQKTSGVIRLGATPLFALQQLPAHVSQYIEQFPDVQVQVVTGSNETLQRYLMDGTLDLAVTTAECRWNGPQYFLSQEPFSVACAPTGQKIDLLDRHYISYPLEEAQSNLIRLWLHENKLPCSGCSSAVDIAVCVELIRSGIGWSILPESLIPKGVKSFPATLLGGEPICLPLTILCQRYVNDSPVFRQFVSVLRKKRL